MFRSDYMTSNPSRKRRSNSDYHWKQRLEIGLLNRLSHQDPSSPPKRRSQNDSKSVRPIQIKGSINNPGRFKTIHIIGDNRYHGVENAFNGCNIRPFFLFKEHLKYSDLKYLFRDFMPDKDLNENALFVCCLGLEDLIEKVKVSSCIDHKKLSVYSVSRTPHTRVLMDKIMIELVSFVMFISQVIGDSSSVVFTDVFPMNLIDYEEYLINDHVYQEGHNIQKFPIRSRMSIIEQEQFISHCRDFNERLAKDNMMSVPALSPWNLHKIPYAKMSIIDIIKTVDRFLVNGYQFRTGYINEIGEKMLQLCREYSGNDFDRIVPLTSNSPNCPFKKIVIVGDDWLTNIKEYWPKYADIEIPVIFEIFDDLSLVNLVDKLASRYHTLSDNLILVSIGKNDLFNFEESVDCVYHDALKLPTLRRMLTSETFFKNNFDGIMNRINDKMIEKLHPINIGYINVYPRDLESYHQHLINKHDKMTGHFIKKEFSSANFEDMFFAVEHLNMWIYNHNERKHLPSFHINDDNLSANDLSFLSKNGNYIRSSVSKKVAQHIAQQINCCIKNKGHSSVPHEQSHKLPFSSSSNSGFVREDSPSRSGSISERHNQRSPLHSRSNREIDRRGQSSFSQRKRSNSPEPNDSTPRNCAASPKQLGPSNESSGKPSKSKIERILADLLEEHVIEYEKYRLNPESHPQYSTMKENFIDQEFIKMAKEGSSVDRTELNNRWSVHWPLKLIEIEEKEWFKKRNYCLAHLVGEQTRNEQSPTPHSRDSNELSISPVRMHANYENNYSIARKSPNYPSNNVQSFNPTHKMQETSSLSRQTHSYHESRATIRDDDIVDVNCHNSWNQTNNNGSKALNNSKYKIPSSDPFEIVDILKILKQLNSAFNDSNVLFRLKTLYEAAVKARDDNNDPIIIFNEGNLSILDVAVDSLSKYIDDTSSVIQKAISMELLDRLSNLKNKLNLTLKTSKNMEMPSLFGLTPDAMRKIADIVQENNTLMASKKRSGSVMQSHFDPSKIGTSGTGGNIWKSAESFQIPVSYQDPNDQKPSVSNSIPVSKSPEFLVSYPNPGSYSYVPSKTKLSSFSMPTVPKQSIPISTSAEHDSYKSATYFKANNVNFPRQICTRISLPVTKSIKSRLSKANNGKFEGHGGLSRSSFDDENEAINDSAYTAVPPPYFK